MKLLDLAHHTFRVRWADARTGERSFGICQRFIEYVGNMEASALSSTDLDDWKAYLLQQGRRGSTVRRYLNDVQGMVTEGQKLGVVGEVETPSVVVVRDEPVFLSREESETLLEYLQDVSPRYRDFCEWQLETGMRLSESLGLKWDDLHPERGVYLNGYDVKNAHGRWVPLTKKAKRLLWNLGWQQNEEGEGPWDHVDKDGLYEAWGYARVKMGQSRNRMFTIHSLRHTCCSRLSEAGVPLRTIQEWMGHRDIKTTMRYAHTNREQLERAAEALERV